MRHNTELSPSQGLLFDYEEEKKAHGETGQKFKDAEDALSSQIKELELKLSVGSESNKSLSSTTEQLQLSIEQILVIKKVCFSVFFSLDFMIFFGTHLCFCLSLIFHLLSVNHTA